jgi:hypothetical protein
MALAIISRCIARHVRLSHVQLHGAVGRQRWLRAVDRSLPEADRHCPRSTHPCTHPHLIHTSPTHPHIHMYKRSSSGAMLRGRSSARKAASLASRPAKTIPMRVPSSLGSRPRLLVWRYDLSVSFYFANRDRIHITSFYHSIVIVPSHRESSTISISCCIAYIAAIEMIMQLSIIDRLP